MDTEEMIMERQESISDDCNTCQYKGNCKNQCMEIEEHYNLVIGIRSKI